MWNPALNKREMLRLSTAQSPYDSAPRVDFSTFATLPLPVQRYFRHVLSDGQQIIRLAEISQRGTLRTDAMSTRWLDFRARQLVVPTRPAFVWDARVTLASVLHVSVQDAYVDGEGSGRVRFLSIIPAGSDGGRPELNSGALHRYLAEAVWYPTALLPSPALNWQPISDTKALATLTDHDVTVALEFWFSSAHEVAAIYTSGRWARFGKSYRKVAWQGYFSEYSERAGMLVPAAGEVGWYLHGGWQAVWKGLITEARYTMAGRLETTDAFGSPD